MRDNKLTRQSSLKVRHRIILTKKEPMKKYVSGCKENIFTACHSGKLKLAFTSPDYISASPKNVLTCRIDFTVLLLFDFLKKHHLPVKIKNSTSLGLSDTTFFARCVSMKTQFNTLLYIICQESTTFFSKTFISFKQDNYLAHLETPPHYNIVKFSEIQT